MSTKSNTKRSSSYISYTPNSISKNYLLKKYNSFQYSFSLQCINNLISNEKCQIVARFKDYLIYDDATEFLKSFFSLDEIYPKLKYIVNFYTCYSRFFPNYIILPENDYLYKNLRKKQKVIDDINEKNTKLQNKNLLKKSLFKKKLFFDSAIQKFINTSRNNDTVFNIYISSIKKANEENEKQSSFLFENNKCLFEESQTSLKIILSNFKENEVRNNKKYLKKSLSTQNSRNFLPRKSNLFKILESSNNNHIFTYINKQYNYNEHIKNKNNSRLNRQNKYLLTKENITNTFSTNCTNTGITNLKAKNNKNINSCNLTKLIKNKRNNLKIDVFSELTKISVNTKLKTISNLNKNSIFHKKMRTVLTSVNKSSFKKLLTKPVFKFPLKKIEKNKTSITKKLNNFIRNNKNNFTIFKTFSETQKNNINKKHMDDFNKISSINKLKEKCFNLYLDKKFKNSNANNQIKNLKKSNDKKDNNNILLSKIEKINIINKNKLDNELKIINKRNKLTGKLHKKNKSALNKNNLLARNLLLFKTNYYICK